MNVANLEIEGLLMVLAPINNMLVHKSVLSIDDIELALHEAEASLTREERSHQELTLAQREAVCFPIRLPRMANNAPPRRTSRQSRN